MRKELMLNYLSSQSGVGMCREGIEELKSQAHSSGLTQTDPPLAEARPTHRKLIHASAHHAAHVDRHGSHAHACAREASQQLLSRAHWLPL